VRSGGDAVAAAHPRRRSFALGACAYLAFLGAALLLAPLADAHALVGRTDVPIPKWLFGWGAAIVLVVSFVGLAVLWPKPQLEEAGRRRLVRLPRAAWVALDVLAGAFGVFLFAVVVYAGFKGTQSPVGNLTPRFVYIFFWIGLVPASLLFGDVFRALNPWRAVGRAFGFVVSRVAGPEITKPLPYPARLGRWPAAVGIVAFAWLELVSTSPGRDDPSRLATLALVYAGIQLVGQALYGTDKWSRYGDAFSVYYNLFSRLSVFERRGNRLLLRPPLTGVADLDLVSGTLPLLCVMIGSTAFDGGAEGPLWSGISDDIRRTAIDAGASLNGALEIASSIGLVLAILGIAAIYLLGISGMRTVGRPDGDEVPAEAKNGGTRTLAGLFVHSLVPIAFAYVLAHYFSALWFEGQAVLPLASDPLGNGHDYFGWADKTVDYGSLSSNVTWYVQVATLVLGHVAGLVLAHDRALRLYKNARRATRSQYWMLVVMVGFTSLGLWLLSVSNQ
jgi:hypothetical protein